MCSARCVTPETSKRGKEKKQETKTEAVTQNKKKEGDMEVRNGSCRTARTTPSYFFFL